MTASPGNRPFIRVDANHNLIQSSSEDMSFRGDYTGTNLIYKGIARPGSLTSDPVWQIAKLSYDISNNLVSIQWAENVYGNASNDYNFIWDHRSLYTYS